MKKAIIVAIIAVTMVAAAGAALYMVQSQTPQSETDSLAAVEQKLNDFEDFTSFEDLNSDFGIGDVAGEW